jgi:hypothetical protein
MIARGCRLVLTKIGKVRFIFIFSCFTPMYNCSSSVSQLCCLNVVLFMKPHLPGLVVKYWDVTEWLCCQQWSAGQE